MKESTRKAKSMANTACWIAENATQHAWHEVTRSKQYRDASTEDQNSEIKRRALAKLQEAERIALKAVEIAETAAAKLESNSALNYCRMFIAKL